MFDELVDYIRENYSRSGKIVEVGVGHRIDVADRIKRSIPLAEVVVTDKDEAWVRLHGSGRVKAVADDVMFPQNVVYQGASLIYSVHPPVELVRAMIEVARKVGADLLVAPRLDEQEQFHDEDWERIVRGGRTVGWRQVFRGQKGPMHS